MPNSHFNPFGFLTPERESLFKLAIHSTNEHLRTSISPKRHVYQEIPNLGKAQSDRAWLVGHIMETICVDPGIRRFELNNMCGVVVDSRYFLRFGKIDDPWNPPREPKTLFDARRSAAEFGCTLPLSGFEEVPDGAGSLELLQGALYPLVGGYKTNTYGWIEAFYYIDQHRDKAKAVRQLNLAIPVPNLEKSPVVELPKATFVLKDKQGRKAEEK